MISFFCASISAISAIVPSGANRFATSTSVGSVAPIVEPMMPSRSTSSVCVVAACASGAPSSASAMTKSENSAPHRNRFFMVISSVLETRRAPR
jgi:hypothetical protein